MQRRLTVVAGLVLAAAIAACSGGPDAPPTPSPTPTVRPTPTPTPTATPTPEPVWPLTGLPAPSGTSAEPVLVVKVDNTASARPQVGLSAADLVVEELVEGGLTRLAVMYHSTLPEAIAPVRSIRTSDIGIVLPTGGALVASGGARRVLRMMDEAGVTVVSEGAAGFSRDSERRPPYSVTADLRETLSEVTGLQPPSDPYLPWAAPGAEPLSGEPASSVLVQFSGSHRTAWDWADGGWHRQDDLAANGDEFIPDTVLVLRVAIRDAGYTDPAGNFVPESVVEGSGDAVLFTAGTAVEATWSKPDAMTSFSVSDKTGRRLDVPAGHTWIELVPEEGDVSWTAR